MRYLFSSGGEGRTTHRRQSSITYLQRPQVRQRFHDCSAEGRSFDFCVQNKPLPWGENITHRCPSVYAQIHLPRPYDVCEQVIRDHRSSNFLFLCSSYSYNLAKPQLWVLKWFKSSCCRVRTDDAFCCKFLAVSLFTRKNRSLSLLLMMEHGGCGDCLLVISSWPGKVIKIGCLASISIPSYSSTLL